MNNLTPLRHGSSTRRVAARRDRPEARCADRRAERSFYEKRKARSSPRRIDGFFRRLKWVVMLVTLGIYYVTPWLRWDRGPYAPDQAVLVDLAHRRFYMFGDRDLAARILFCRRAC